jgi:hypothetical protein
VKRAPITRRCAGSGKRIYATRNEARKTVRRFASHGQVYRCTFCGEYHVTSQSERVTAAIRLLLSIPS